MLVDCSPDRQLGTRASKGTARRGAFRFVPREARRTFAQAILDVSA